MEADSALTNPAVQRDTPSCLPVQPKAVHETGLELALLAELVAKAICVAGKLHLSALNTRLRLSISVLREVLDFLQAERLVEVSACGDSDLDIQYQLTGDGKLRAAEYLARNRYIGPAPVPLETYRALVARQSAHHPNSARVTAADIAAALGDELMDAAVRDLLGAALQSSRSLLLYGPSGSGKTTLARKLGLLQHGVIAVPHAILVEQQIIEVYDPRVHLPPSPLLPRHSDERRNLDSRWELCQRPLVQVGAELDKHMLDLRQDETGGVYRAPPHFLANNGILLVDDLGRQPLSTSDLLNRWSGPLDSGTDQLTLHGGHKLAVPFDLTLVFATNLAPQLLLDDSAMRRIAYKILVGELSESNYRALFRRQCAKAGMQEDEDVIDHLITRLHLPAGRALLASHPRALLGRIGDFARFAGTDARLSIPAIEQAWASMFSACTPGASAAGWTAVDSHAPSGEPLPERVS